MFTLRKIESSQELSSGFDSDEETILLLSTLRGQDDDEPSPQKTFTDRC